MQLTLGFSVVSLIISRAKALLAIHNGLLDFDENATAAKVLTSQALAVGTVVFIGDLNSHLFLGKDLVGRKYVSGTEGTEGTGPRDVCITGDSHTMAVTESGEVWGWGTFRDTGGVFGFSPGTHIQLVPVEVYHPGALDTRVAKVSSGATPQYKTESRQANHNSSHPSCTFADL